ncbi:MAG: Na+/H+ antiporter NhaC family protein [Gemmatimonadota bacterium]|nr:Na+/H+ antiporter NhaC family protein [Gemmatimonadota bacterium]
MNPKTTEKNRVNTSVRVLTALSLAAVFVAILPDNRDRVIHQQVVSELPLLSRALGDGPWRLADNQDPRCRSGFEEVRRRRKTPLPGASEIVVGCSQDPEGLVLTASTASSQRRTRLKSIDGWSLYPPIAAILVAIFSGRVLLGLSLAVLCGGVLTAGDAPIHVLPFAAFERAAVNYVWTPLRSSFQLYILGFTAALIGMVRVTSLAGGNQGIAALLASRSEGAKSTRLAAFFMGLAIFFDDYANTIVVGTTFRPMADRFRISREKLAYIVDSTAAPVAGVAVISTWIGFEVGLFGDLMRDLGTGVSGYQLFFHALPFRFYCLFTLAFVAASAWLQRDYGPMYRAEYRARTTGQVLRPGATPMAVHRSRETLPAEGVRPAWWAAAAPVLIVVAAVIGGMAADTWNDPEVRPIRLASSLFSFPYWTACFSNADNARVLFLSAILGSAVALVIAVTRRRPAGGPAPIRPLTALKTWAQGVTGIHYAIAVLIMAWAIQAVCKDIGTSTYLAAALSPIAAPGLLPLLIFLLAASVAFSIGTSWATMAILIPTAVPLAHSMGGFPLTILAAAAVLDGAIFGDHCSPISDTTVMSSLATSCDHLDHVRTQFPYALTTMGIAALAGYVGATFFYPVWCGLLIGLAIIPAILIVFGRNADRNADT